MIDWSYDIEAAKSAGTILACSDGSEKSSVDGVAENWVGWTWWKESEQRWVMMGSNQKPLCWALARHPMDRTPGDLKERD